MPLKDSQHHQDEMQIAQDSEDSRFPVMILYAPQLLCYLHTPLTLSPYFNSSELEHVNCLFVPKLITNTLILHLSILHKGSTFCPS